MGFRELLWARSVLAVVLRLLGVLELTRGSRLSSASSSASSEAFIAPCICRGALPNAKHAAACSRHEAGLLSSALVAGNGGGPNPFTEMERHWVDYYAQRSAEFSPALPEDVEDTPNSGKGGPQGRKYYVLSMIPYPSGSGLHMGHCYTYTLADVAARYQRLKLRAALLGARDPEQPLENSASTSVGCGPPPQQTAAQEAEAHQQANPPQPNVLHVMGWDSFGLPAEQHAREKGEAPASVVSKNIRAFRRQLQRLGISVDWRRQVSTSDPQFFRWTQWGFLQMLKRGLAYEKEAEVNWCPSLGTVLANEELTAEGLSERGRFPVERRWLRQWHLRLRVYAERLLKGLSLLDWPADVLQMQRNWIGKEVYARLQLETTAGGPPLSCLLVPPEHILGCTAVVLHPGHPLVSALGRAKEATTSQAGGPRAAGAVKGFDSGLAVLHPLTRELLPVIVSAAVEAIPQFGLQLSERDALLASPEHQPFAAALAAAGLLPPSPSRATAAQTRDAVNACAGDWRPCEQLRGRDHLQEAQEALQRLRESSRIQEEVRYRLRDWVFSRQRYWGEPIPVVRVGVGEQQQHKARDAGGPADGDGLRDADDTRPYEVLPVPENALPLNLPPFNASLVSMPPAAASADAAAAATSTAPREAPGFAALAALSRYTDWVWGDTRALPSAARCNSAAAAKRVCRETSTMPQWAGSSWYHLRFVDPHNREALARPSLLKFWLPVDLYVGGKEHAVTHLIYSRFWHKVLLDIGAACYEEPFKRLVTPGVILGAPRHFLLRRRDSGAPVSAAEVELSPAAAAAVPSAAAAAAAAARKICGLHRPSGAEVYAEPLPANSTLVRQTSNGTWVLSPQNQGTRDTQTTAAAAAAGEAGVESLEVLTLSEKMSKSRGNAVSPDALFETHGADVLRIHLMSLGPVAATKHWREEGLLGASRLLRRIWQMFVSLPPSLPPAVRGSQSVDGGPPRVFEGAPSSPQAASTQEPPASEGPAGGSPTGCTVGALRGEGLRGVSEEPMSEAERKLLCPLVSEVTRYLERLQVNKAVAALMTGSRRLQQLQQQPQSSRLSVSAAQTLLLLLHPLAPFVTEELWARLSAQFPGAFKYPGWSLAAAGEWPEAERGAVCDDSSKDAAAVRDEGEVEVSVQIDGRQRLRVRLAATALENNHLLSSWVQREPQVQHRLQRETARGRKLTTVIAKPRARLVNFVFD